MNPHFPIYNSTFSSYYPFGMLQPGRHGGESYRYGFQGQESDNEIKGQGNSVNYKYRMHDPRLGRFFAVDPLTSKYPHYSPYSFSGNKVIHKIELEGLEEADPIQRSGTYLGISNSYEIKELEKIKFDVMHSKVKASELVLNSIVNEVQSRTQKNFQFDIRVLVSEFVDYKFSSETMIYKSYDEKILTENVIKVDEVVFYTEQKDFNFYKDKYGKTIDDKAKKIVSEKLPKTALKKGVEIGISAVAAESSAFVLTKGGGLMVSFILSPFETGAGADPIRPDGPFKYPEEIKREELQEVYDVLKVMFLEEGYSPLNESNSTENEIK